MKHEELAPRVRWTRFLQVQRESGQLLATWGEDDSRYFQEILDSDGLVPVVSGMPKPHAWVKWQTGPPDVQKRLPCFHRKRQGRKQMKEQLMMKGLSKDYVGITLKACQLLEEFHQGRDTLSVAPGCAGLEPAPS